MIEQLQQVEGNFQTNYVKILGERYLTIGQQRFRLARRLYFHVMESMLKMVTGFLPFWNAANKFSVLTGIAIPVFMAFYF